MSTIQEENKISLRKLQSPEKEKEVNRIIQIVSEDKSRRDQQTQFFRNETLITYTNIALGQFIGFNEKPEYKQDYQYNLFDPITRDKVMAIISKTNGMYEAQFFNTNKELEPVSETISNVLGAFYKQSTRELDEKTKNRLTMLTALITPKAIWYEGWRHQKRIIRDIEERDETGRITKTAPKKIVHYSGPYGYLLQVEDVVFGSLAERDLQEQPRIATIPKMQYSTFKRLFPETRYPDSAKVCKHGLIFGNDLTDFTVRNDLTENEVEVVTFYEKWEDRMSIIANGILLTEINNPMPFAHKDYPLVWGGFEELSPFFIYDMPLSMKLLDMQDMNNEVLNLTLDMVWRALNDVILVQSGDGINEDVIYGGGLVDVDDPKNFQKLEFGSSFAFNSATAMMERAKRSIESASLDAPSSGQSGSRNITAREALIAREAALEITTLFLTSMENMEREKARLRTLNQLDRYKSPIEWQDRIGENGVAESIKVFKDLSVRDARLDGGKRGNLNINITETPRPKDELEKENIQNDKVMSQTIDLSPELIRKIKFDVEIVANSVVKKTKMEERAEARAFLQDSASMPQILSVPYAAEEYVKTLNKNPKEALVQQDQEQLNDPLQQLMAQRQGGKAQDTPDLRKNGDSGSMEEMINELI
jgi:hypothetical protein